MIKRTPDQVKKKIAEVAADYVRDPSDRTLGYLQLLINYYSALSRLQSPSDRPAFVQPIFEKIGQGRTDALEWLHGEGR